MQERSAIEFCTLETPSESHSSASLQKRWFGQSRNRTIGKPFATTRVLAAQEFCPDGRDTSVKHLCFSPPPRIAEKRLASNLEGPASCDSRIGFPTVQTGTASKIISSSETGIVRLRRKSALASRSRCCSTVLSLPPVRASIKISTVLPNDGVFRSPN